MKRQKKIIIAILAILFCIIVCCCQCWKGFSPADSLYLIDDKNAGDIQSSKKYLVVVVHGWLDKGSGDWPEDMAKQIAKRIDCNQWVCGYFDWSRGADAINPSDAAQYGRDVAGHELADKIQDKFKNVEHIHLIAHSSGCWVISEAAKILASSTNANMHLTFLDAYVPPGWNDDSLGNFSDDEKAVYWTEHYFTRDYTLGWTQKQLKYAHNVDITSMDFGIKDHKFPWRWYYATISGKYPKSNFHDSDRYRCIENGVEYGFALSLEASGKQQCQKTFNLPMGNAAIKASSTKGQ